MIADLVAEPDDRLLAKQAKHLSFSRINRYLTCPWQYRLYYLTGLRQRYPSASLIFGQTIHQSIALYVGTREDPVGYFLEAWRKVETTALTYSTRESWSSLRNIGSGLLEKFVNEEAPKLRNIQAIEKSFELSITNLELPLVGIIDLVADYETKRTVIDFKTSASSYDEHEAALSDQLTAYHLAVPDAAQSALCVLVKTKQPKIEWHVTNRDGEQLTEFLAKAEMVASDIDAGRFFKRVGRHCGWCDYLPVCLRDKERAEETLVQIEIG